MSVCPASCELLSDRDIVSVGSQGLEESPAIKHRSMQACVVSEPIN